MGWMAWDLMRGVDLLLARPGIDPERIILLGAVAGGGDPAAVTAALDPRITAVVPFNFGGPQPETHYPLPDDAEDSFNYAGGVDIRVALFSFGIAGVATALFGFVPALQAIRPKRAPSRARAVLVATQVATGCTLLVVGGLLARGLQHVVSVPLGFDYADHITISPDLHSNGFKPAAAAEYLDRPSRDPRTDARRRRHHARESSAAGRTDLVVTLAERRDRGQASRRSRCTSR